MSKIPVIEIRIDKKTDRINFDTKNINCGMVKKTLEKYNITRFGITKNYNEPYYLFTKSKGIMHRIGTVKLTKDNRFCVDKLDLTKIKEIR